MRGYVERVDRYRVTGWAVDPGDPARPLTVEIHLAGRTIAQAGTTQFRSDLKSAGYGEGWHGFEAVFTAPLDEEALGRIEVVVVPAGWHLPFLPHAVATAAAAPALSATGAYRSRFGGVWTDRSDAAAILDGKLERNEISTAEHALLAGWIEHGYVILKGVVDPALCDRVVVDAERAACGDLGPLFREVAGADGVRILPASAGRDGKLIDLYTRSQAALDVIAAPAIGRFLRLVFEQPALAFQSLYFEYGSRQPLHQDTAFVPVSAPLAMAASWTALEDVTAGSGELVYAPGSHAIAEYLFEDRLKAMPPRSHEEQTYYAHLLAEIDARKLALARFLPRKGDVLIWSADLVHGGSPIEDRNRHLTRRSLVAHYCPNDCRPGYFDPSHDNRRQISPDIFALHNVRPH